MDVSDYRAMDLARRLMPVLFVAGCVLGGLDAFSTARLLGRGFYEGNPVMRALMRAWGVDAVLMLRVAFGPILLGSIWAVSFRWPGWAIRVGAVAVAAWAAVVALNLSYS